MLFTSPGAKLLRELAANYPALREEQTEVLAVVEALGPDFLPVEPSTGTKLAFPFPILLDRDGSSHKLAGADRRRQALYIADRFGEVFGAFRESEGSAIPSVAEIIEQVRFINIQCDECAHPEWPPV